MAHWEEVDGELGTVGVASERWANAVVVVAEADGDGEAATSSSGGVARGRGGDGAVWCDGGGRFWGEVAAGRTGRRRERAVCVCVVEGGGAKEERGEGRSGARRWGEGALVPDPDRDEERRDVGSGRSGLGFGVTWVG